MSEIFIQVELLRSFVLFLMLGSVAGVIVGALLLWRPEWLVRVNKHANFWVSTRKMGRKLEQQINIDRWFYRYGRVSGFALLSGAVYIIYGLMTHFGRADLLASLTKLHLVQPVLLEPLLDIFVLIVLTGVLLALFVSLFLMFRPSILREMELDANRSVSLRQVLKPMEIQRSELDVLVLQHAKKSGLILLCGSLYTLVILAFWLSR